MKVEEIKNVKLRKLLDEGKYSYSIGASALDNAATEDEIIIDWQERLKNLKTEVEYYLSELETLKKIQSRSVKNPTI